MNPKLLIGKLEVLYIISRAANKSILSFSLYLTTGGPLNCSQAFGIWELILCANCGFRFREAITWAAPSF